MSDKYGKYVGLPWKRYGEDRSGIDCWGLVRLFYFEVFGIAIPNSGAANRFRQISDPQPGDIGMWVTPKGWHAGVVAPRRRFLHINENETSMLSPLNSARLGVRRQYFRWAA